MNVERRLRIEHLERCMNCRLFPSCTERGKEDIECCELFDELDSKDQVVVISLERHCRLEGAPSQKTA